MVQTDECINYEDVTPLSGNRFGTWGEFGFGAAFKKKTMLHRKIAQELNILFLSCYTYSENIAEWLRSFEL